MSPDRNTTDRPDRDEGAVGRTAVQIRLAVPEERTSVEELVAAAYGHYVPRIGRKPGPMLDDYGLLISQKRVFVLTCDGRIEGLVVLIPEANAMLLDNVALRPTAQGRGYGRRLVAFAEQSARDAGFQTIRLYTHQLMTENLALYAHLGFIETHQAEEKGFNRVFMSKSLKPAAGDRPTPA